MDEQSSAGAEAFTRCSISASTSAVMDYSVQKTVPLWTTKGLYVTPVPLVDLGHGWQVVIWYSSGVPGPQHLCPGCVPLQGGRHPLQIARGGVVLGDGARNWGFHCRAIEIVTRPKLVVWHTI